MSRKKPFKPKYDDFVEGEVDDDPIEPLPKGFKIDKIEEGKMVDNKAFFRAMFQTFGITILIFFGLLVLILVIRWLSGS